MKKIIILLLGLILIVGCDKFNPNTDICEKWEIAGVYLSDMEGVELYNTEDGKCVDWRERENPYKDRVEFSRVGFDKSLEGNYLCSDDFFCRVISNYTDYYQTLHPSSTFRICKDINEENGRCLNLLEEFDTEEKWCYFVTSDLQIKEMGMDCLDENLLRIIN